MALNLQALAESLQEELTENDHHQIALFLKDLSKEQLVSLAPALGLSYAKYRGKEENLLGDIISGWLKMENRVVKTPSWEVLINALEEIGQNGIAAKIRQSSFSIKKQDPSPLLSIQSQVSTPPQSPQIVQHSSDGIIAPANVANIGASSLEAKFQYLKTEHLSQEEKKLLFGRLEVESKRIRQKFVGLVMTTSKSLEARAIIMEKIVLLLESYDINLSGHKTIHEVLVTAGKYWSFFNYGILESLIDYLGDDSDRERLARYKSDFKEYCKRRLCEVPIDALKSDRNSTTRLYVKTDKTFNVPTEDIYSLATELSDLLGTTLLLLDVKDGCVELDFDYLKEDNLLPLLKDDHSDMFMKLGITKLYTDRQIFYEKKSDKNKATEEQEKPEIHEVALYKDDVEQNQLKGERDGTREEIVLCEEKKEAASKLEILRKEHREQIDSLKSAVEVLEAEKRSLKDVVKKLEDDKMMREKEHEVTATARNQLEIELREVTHQHGQEREKLMKKLHKVESQTRDDLLRWHADKDDLEQAIADISRLSDEVLSKNQQIKQYKKQGDGYAAKLREEEMKTQELEQRLKHFVDQLEKKELEHQEEITLLQAQFVSDKTKMENTTKLMKKELEERRTHALGQGQYAESHKRIAAEKSAAYQKMEEMKESYERNYKALDESYMLLDKRYQALCDDFAAMYQQQQQQGIYPPQQVMNYRQHQGMPPSQQQPPQQGSMQQQLHSQQGILPQPQGIPSSQEAKYPQQPTFQQPSQLPQQQILLQQQQQQQGMHGGYPPSGNGGGYTATAQLGQNQTQENVLIRGIDQEISEVAVGIKKEAIDMRPLDSNLICPFCNKQFRIGQIQEYKQHVDTCVGYNKNQDMCGWPHFPVSGNPEPPLENILIKGIDQEISEIAVSNKREVYSPTTTQQEKFEEKKPLDPNLICPMCSKQFRIGQIQKYKQHVEKCQSSSNLICPICSKEFEIDKSQDFGQHVEKCEFSCHIIPADAIEPIGDFDRGAYGSVSLVRVRGMQCIKKEVHPILVGYGGREPVAKEDKERISKKFHLECALLSRLHHPNIVQFLGVHFTSSNRLNLIMEYVPMSVRKCLDRCSKEHFDIPLSFKLSILHDMSTGLMYLHSCDIVHRDLSAGNILLTSDLRAKIADFGVSRELSPTGQTKLTKVPGTPDIMPPEAMKEGCVYNYKMDIFSCGVLALYILLQTDPTPSNDGIKESDLRDKTTEIGKRIKFVEELTKAFDPQIKLTVSMCLQDEPGKRPTTSDLNQKLQSLCEQYPNQYGDTMQMLQTIKKLYGNEALLSEQNTELRSQLHESHGRINQLTYQLQQQQRQQEEIDHQASYHMIKRSQSDTYFLHEQDLHQQNQDLKVEIDILMHQITIYQEDFQNERSDRERANKELQKCKRAIQLMAEKHGITLGLDGLPMQ